MESWIYGLLFLKHLSTHSRIFTSLSSADPTAGILSDSRDCWRDTEEQKRERTRRCLESRAVLLDFRAFLSQRDYCHTFTVLQHALKAENHWDCIQISSSAFCSPPLSRGDCCHFIRVQDEAGGNAALVLKLLTLIFSDCEAAQKCLLCLQEWKSLLCSHLPLSEWTTGSLTVLTEVIVWFGAVIVSEAC